jgi:hypothetical protein
LQAQHREIEINIENNTRYKNAPRYTLKVDFEMQVRAGPKNTQHIDNKPPPAHQIC